MGEIDFLPGKFVMERGGWGDYRELARFHYIQRKPATWSQIWVVRYVERESANPPFEFPQGRRQAVRRRGRFAKPQAVMRSGWNGSRLVGVGVVSFPVPSCGLRRRALGIEGSRAEELRFVNEHMRTISRVIVHPQFRALGLSSWLVRCICEHCDTRYTEALAVMGRAHPFFEKAGMRRFDPVKEGGAVYFLFDRENKLPRP
jgi:GNAT superfamily N-acetyltransferase